MFCTFILKVKPISVSTEEISAQVDRISWVRNVSQKQEDSSKQDTGITEILLYLHYFILYLKLVSPCVPLGGKHFFYFHEGWTWCQFGASAVPWWAPGGGFEFSLLEAPACQTEPLKSAYLFSLPSQRTAFQITLLWSFKSQLNYDA